MAHVLHTVEYRVRCTRCGETWTEIDEDTTPSDLRPGARHEHSCRRCGTIVEARVVETANGAPPRAPRRARRKAQRTRA